MGEPHVGPEPAEAVHVVHRRAAEVLAAVRVLVHRLGQVGVQPHALAPGQRGRLGEQFLGHGERRARRHAYPHHGFGRRIVVGVDGGLGGGQDPVDVLDHVVRRQAAVALPQVHRAPGRVEAQPDLARRADLGREHVPAVAGEDVVVIGGGGAAGGRQPRQASSGRREHDLGVDAAPHRVQLGEPAEQGGVHRQAARRPLVEVMVGVHQAGRGQAPGGVDVPGAGEVAGGGPGGDGADPAALDHDMAAVMLGARAVHGHHRAAVEHYGRVHRQLTPVRRAAARRTASMIFS